VNDAITHGIRLPKLKDSQDKHFTCEAAKKPLEKGAACLLEVIGESYRVDSSMDDNRQRFIVAK
jgi:hypothetical protein